MRLLIDRYAHLDSPLHRWDPRWKLASLGILMFSLAVSPALVRGDLPASSAARARDLAHAFISLGLGLALVELSRIPMRFALSRLLAPAIFLLAFVALYPLSAPGEGPRLGSLTFSIDGLLAATAMALRALAILLIALPLFGTSPFDVTMKALRSLRVPGPVVQLVTFAYRYLYVSLDEVIRMRTAMRSRGFRGRPLPHALRTLGNALGMLLVRSVERTERIQAAMAARGYTGIFRTFEDFRTRPADVLGGALALAIAAALLVWRIAP